MSTPKITQEIATFHDALHIAALRNDFYVPASQIDIVITEIARLVADRDWSGYQNQLFELHQGLTAFKRVLLRPPLPPIVEPDEEYRDPASLPSHMQKELEALEHENPVQLQQKVVQMLDNVAWNPLRCKLLPLKLRADDLVKKEHSGETLDKIDRIGISNLIFIIQATEGVFLEMLASTVSSDHIQAITSESLNEVQKQIESNPKSALDHAAICKACLNSQPVYQNAYPIAQLLIRAGAPVNGLSPPLDSAFCGFDTRFLKEKNKREVEETRKKMIKLLLDSGADPNIMTIDSQAPRVRGSRGCKRKLIFSLISKSDAFVDSLLPLFVDQGKMDVNAISFKIDTRNVVHVVSALSAACMTPDRLNFVRALIFNNAAVQAQAREYATKQGIFLHFNRWVGIRTSICEEMSTALANSLNSLQFLPVVLAKVVASYALHVPDMRRLCYERE